MLKVNEFEYKLMKDYIEKQCGIHLEQGKEYLIETRLSDLVIENGCNSFSEFHNKITKVSDGALKDRIVDAMTTNETLWFRDATAWTYLKDYECPGLLDKAEKNEQVRIWSAAASTGQEGYSLLMVLDELARMRGNPALMNNISILGTDISSSALFLAIAGRYDSFTIKRGMPEITRNKYFKQSGNVWIFDQELKKKVKFQRFNLQNDYSMLGKFDLILLRYVTIYFSDKLKKNIYSKMARSLKTGGKLLLGATESIRGYSEDFDIKYYKNSVYNVVK